MILLITSLSFFLGRALVSGLDDIYQSLTGAGESKERLSVFIIQISDRAVAFVNRYTFRASPHAFPRLDVFRLVFRASLARHGSRGDLP